ncbi:hypothetical protein SARC_00065 [Sphaeroforma arctica JP610]|uniref:Uncharacterized protein n=1 Tax=Sphaeroforma arctica JP610 TaxID=667725 RepID=A0A0L0GHI8_9EUKA|nr:hypothetical protein SARC_00065 [Sphaeroforma arctica JP610]KNC87808.1 hypothetical protein SARC_00065 [Sphaeroforma arctica JP610]|eukprot:XP_014161710.1 hypothetical protein SARC_00065 [Sphaeroforma arctica JP610]
MFKDDLQVLLDAPHSNDTCAPHGSVYEIITDWIEHEMCDPSWFETALHAHFYSRDKSCQQLLLDNKNIYHHLGCAVGTPSDPVNLRAFLVLSVPYVDHVRGKLFDEILRYYEQQFESAGSILDRVRDIVGQPNTDQYGRLDRIEKTLLELLCRVRGMKEHYHELNVVRCEIQLLYYFIHYHECQLGLAIPIPSVDEGCFHIFTDEVASDGREPETSLQEAP